MAVTGFPGSSIPIIDVKTGRATNAFWLLLQSIWEKAGGFDDQLAELATGDANLTALINAVDESTHESDREIEAIALQLAGFQKQEITGLTRAQVMSIQWMGF